MHCLAFLERISFSTLSTSFLRINQIKLKQQIFKNLFREKTPNLQLYFCPRIPLSEFELQKQLIFLWVYLSFKFWHLCVFLAHAPFHYFSPPFPNSYLSSPLTAGVFYWLFFGFCQFINIFLVCNSKWIFQLLSESCTMRNYPCAFMNQWLLCKAKSSFSLPVVFTFPLIPFVLAFNFFFFGKHHKTNNTLSHLSLWDLMIFFKKNPLSLR